MPEKHKFSGTNQKPERRQPFGTSLVRHCPQGLFSPFFTFLRAIYFSACLGFSSSPLSAPGSLRIQTSLNSFQLSISGADPGEVKWLNFHPLFLSPSSIMLMHRPQTPQPGFGSITLLQKFTPHFKILDLRLHIHPSFMFLCEAWSSKVMTS